MNEMESWKDKSIDIQNVFKVSLLIRDEITSLEDQIPWPAQPEQLTPDKFTITPLLDTLFTGMYTGRICGKESTRISRLKLSQAQDLVYGITRG